MYICIFVCVYTMYIIPKSGLDHEKKNDLTYKESAVGHISSWNGKQTEELAKYLDSVSISVQYMCVCVCVFVPNN